MISEGSMVVRDGDSQDRKSAFSFFLTMFSAHVVWWRRTGELVDGPHASHITPTALDRWEATLEDLFQARTSNTSINQNIYIYIYIYIVESKERESEYIVSVLVRT
ncbi:hypothetical protein NC653_010943 [Populus alba x Populus x berolinensis]|uniref:Uncharacterized protein n=1 Tax=Populus alba x Populus x berolinensis TaxID=444605 RepID=A0AAD6R150_9ROSI|nr:hypothetical protein NC653_010943 [Populus alba x Populus x berolinensis]